MQVGFIDSGYANHMTHDKDLFRELRSKNITKAQIGSGKYITIEEKGIVTILNLINVGQLIGNVIKFC